MSKENKIDAAKLVQVVHDNAENTTDIVWNGLEITINHTISLKDMCEFVSYVTQLCFTDSGEYFPEIKDFAIKCCVLEKYANLTLPSDISEKHDVVYLSDIVNTVLRHVDEIQFREIVNAINSKVSNLAQANIETINSQVNKLNAEFENLISTFESLFKGVDLEELTAFAKSVFNGSVDEGEFIKAYINSSKNKNVIPISGDGDR